MSKPSTSTAPAPSTSSVKTRRSLEKKQNIDIIGKTSHQIMGAKLPSNKQVLQVMFHNMRFVLLDKTQSANLSIDAAIIFWKQARIPTRDHHKCAEKLLKLYEKWMNIQRTVPNKRSNKQKQTAEQFVEILDDLFDIAAADALQSIRIEEDRAFLEMQLQKGRPGSMAGVDMVLHGREQRAYTRKEQEEARKKRYEEEMSRNNFNYYV